MSRIFLPKTVRLLFLACLSTAGILISCVKHTRARNSAEPAVVSPAAASRTPEIRAVHEFDPDLIRRIVTPNRKNGEDLLQYPFVANDLLKKVMKALDQNKSIAQQMQIKYGLNEYDVSYLPDDASTFSTVGDHTSGVSPNCFLCHSSFIGTKFAPGLGNTRIDLRTFFQDLIFANPHKDILALPDMLRKLPDLYDGVTLDNGLVAGIKDFRARTELLKSVFGFVADPNLQSISAGTSNPWSFAVYLFNWRKDNMDYRDDGEGRGLEPDAIVLDPMPWWQLKYKEFINWDGLITKSARVVVQAVLSPGRSGEQVRGMDPTFERIFAEIEKLDPPVYPKLDALDFAKVEKGEAFFNTSCASCHGVHSEKGAYLRDPEKFKKRYGNLIISQTVIGTDPMRADTIDFAYLRQLEHSWLAHYGEEVAPKYKFRHMDGKVRGYQAPPLWGIWASAPYFHNGSVPKLKAVLFPDLRPIRWRLRVINDSMTTPYDMDDVGLVVDTDLTGGDLDTKIYDTTRGDGRSKDGHEQIMERLTPEQREDVYEYLKTL